MRAQATKAAAPTPATTRKPAVKAPSGAGVDVVACDDRAKAAEDRDPE